MYDKAFPMLILLLTIRVRQLLGEVASIKDYPHHVAILFKNNPLCGGSIISAKFILTTAQCIFALLVEDLQVRIGSDFSNINGSLHDVKEIRIHPDFNEISLDFDLGMLELYNEVPYSETSRNVDLCNDDDLRSDYSKCQVLAWNMETNNMEVSDISIIDQEYCEDIYITVDAPITNRMMCWQFKAADFCRNDIGGSLICPDRHLIGMRSWGFGCTFKEFPEVFTNLRTLRHFINGTINDYNEFSY